MNHRSFLFGLAGISFLVPAFSSAQVWRKVCVSTVTGSDTCNGLPVSDWKQICTSEGNCASRAYFAGGRYFSDLHSSIDSVNFETGSRTALTQSLSLARHSLSGINSSHTGYFCGGVLTTAATSVSEIDAVVFANNSAANPSAALAVARYYSAGVNSSARGYVGGGITTSSARSNEIDGIRFDTEAAVNPAAGLAVSRYALAGVNSSSRGYFAGGYAASVSAEIDGIRFDTEGAVNPAAALTTARQRIASINSEIKGFLFSSGVMDGINFGTETVFPLALMLPLPGSLQLRPCRFRYKITQRLIFTGENNDPSR